MTAIIVRKEGKIVRIHAHARSLAEAIPVCAQLNQQHNQDALEYVCVESAEDLQNVCTEGLMRQLRAHLSALMGFGPDPIKVEARIEELLAEGGEMGKDKRDRDPVRAARKTWEYIASNCTPDLFAAPKKAPARPAAPAVKGEVNEMVIVKEGACVAIQDSKRFIFASEEEAKSILAAAGDDISKTKFITSANAIEQGVEDFLSLAREVIESMNDNVAKRTRTPGATKQVWVIADSMPGAKRADVIAACLAAGINAGTASTQYQKWKQAQTAAPATDAE